MQFIFKIIIIAILGYFVALFLPWWSVALVSFLVNLWLPSKGFNSFISGFLGIGLLWLIYSLIIDIDTGWILSSRIAGMFGFSTASIMIAISGLVGGIVGGFAALSGSHFRHIFIKEEPKRGYYS